MTIQEILGSSGVLAKVIPGFVVRHAQVELAEAITQTLQQKSVLVAEAGTGTGKTFAYLLPCLLSGQKALISTATKTLQDQLFNKDLPVLIKAVGRAVRVQNLKGRANYICRYRVAVYAEVGHTTSPQCAQDILWVRDKLPRLTEGVRSELPEIAEDAAVWPYVTSTTENCLGGDCAYYQDCFLVKARMRSLKADIVVINHHLFFADDNLKTAGFGELLPKVDLIVFDEAHQLPEIATIFQGERVSTRQCITLMEDLLQEWPALDLPNQPLKDYHVDLQTILDKLIFATEGDERRIEWRELTRKAAFNNAFAELIALMRAIGDIAAVFDTTENPGMKRINERLLFINRNLHLLNVADKSYIRWVERFKMSLSLNLTPVEIKDTFTALITQASAAIVFTSATLTMANSFKCFLQTLGLESATTLFLNSPFNFQQQTLLYLPRGLPDPKTSDYELNLVARALPIIDACGGRCFFLFTSYRALNAVAILLKKKLKYPLLIQGNEAKTILLARFRELGNAVLLGTDTFWEGVDVKGEALSCVIIDKLPFPSPKDPIMQGRMAHARARGVSSFDTLALPQAILALKQGVGRLIRDVTDNGVLMIADPRLTARSYGEIIFKSLPLMPKTREEAVVLAFIREKMRIFT